MSGVATVIRRVMLVVALSGAIIVGLLAMHTLTGGSIAAPAGMSMEHDTVHGTHDHAVVGNPGTARGENATAPVTTATSACSGDCESPPNHDMALMGCVLGLVILLLLLSPRLGQLRHHTAGSNRTGSAIRRVTSIARPPDLTSLCISRT